MVLLDTFARALRIEDTVDEIICRSFIAARTEMDAFQGAGKSFCHA